VLLAIGLVFYLLTLLTFGLVLYLPILLTIGLVLFHGSSLAPL
jgi:hypothetical protein